MTTNYNRRFKHEISQQLAQIRISRRQPIFEVAKDCCLPPQLIDRLECGGRQISWKTYYRLIDYYNYRVMLVPQP